MFFMLIILADIDGLESKIENKEIFVAALKFDFVPSI
jgi:hypothetical protein